MSVQKQWYVLRAIGGKEKKAKENIEAEVVRRGIQDLIGEVVVPVEKVYQQRNGKKVLKEQILYSGYVFVECAVDKNGKIINDVRAVLANVANVLGFLGDSNPQPMRASEVTRMIGRVDEVVDDTEEAPIPFVVGETVKVIDGSFSGFSGDIEKVDEEKKKLSVMIKIFGRKTPLELNYYQVEKEA